MGVVLDESGKLEKIGSMANRHFGKFADVWKHLSLMEVLAREQPVRYAETHAGSAAYALVDDAERRFGVRHFVDAACRHPALAQSRYLALIAPLLGRVKPLYPGSALLAMRALGAETTYLFCDLDPASVVDLRAWTLRVGAGRAEVAHGDGVATTARWLDQGGGERSAVHVDPFDPDAKGESGLSALELAARVVDQGQVLIYWYGYDWPEQAAWAFETLGALTGRDLWCGDMMIVDQSGAGRHGDLGAATTPGTGCGVVLGNATAETVAACERLGHALAEVYQGATLPSGELGGVRFAAFCAT
jgi:23S rRNA A2030 N6-methylase RlmJ